MNTSNLNNYISSTNTNESLYKSYSYTFSGKERDAETGLSYFGARYYDANLGIWLSVDPLAAKYPSTSPYAYCRNNPIMLVDPNGMGDSPYYDANGNFLGVDENGFSGKIYITDKATFDANSKNGVADSKSIQASENTKEFYASRGKLTNSAINKILTNVISGTEMPYGGGVIKEGDFDVKRSNASQYNGKYLGVENGKHQMEFSAGAYEWTVENIKGLAIHEIWGHGVKGYANFIDDKHYLVYGGQMDSKYWNKSTDRYKKHITENYYRFCISEIGTVKNMPLRHYQKVMQYYWNK